jgi:hypothetical protein
MILFVKSLFVFDRAIASDESDRALKDQNEPQRRKDHKGEEK